MSIAVTKKMAKIMSIKIIKQKITVLIVKIGILKNKIFKRMIKMKKNIKEMKKVNN